MPGPAIPSDGGAGPLDAAVLAQRVEEVSRLGLEGPDARAAIAALDSVADSLTALLDSDNSRGR